MERGLVLFTGSVQGEDLLETALEYAASTDAELVLYAVTRGRSRSTVQRAVERVESQLLTDYDVEYRVLYRRVGDSFDRQFLDAAAEHDCDHLFLLSRPRSGILSFLERDPIADVVAEFDGFVTVNREATSGHSPGSDDSLWDAADQSYFSRRLLRRSPAELWS